MKRNHAALIAFVASLNLGAMPGVARAQCSYVLDMEPVTSSGLSIEVMRIVPQSKAIVIEFMATNKSSTRAYVIDAHLDESQKAILGSGAHLGSPATAGIKTAGPRSAEACAASENCSHYLGDFSYIEPGSVLQFSLTYSLPTPVKLPDTISMSLAFVLRSAWAVTDTVEADDPKVVRFPFDAIPMCF